LGEDTLFFFFQIHYDFPDFLDTIPKPSGHYLLEHVAIRGTPERRGRPPEDYRVLSKLKKG
jgi:hypothetical protein